MGTSRGVFLSAEWRWLAMLNFTVDASVLAPLVPAGTELALYDDSAYMSLVGFRFVDTRVRGVPIPFHRNFEEVNLRFYVRRKVDGAWRRGAVFVKELVPKRAIAWVARSVSGENYHAVPMRHAIREPSGPKPGWVSYEWMVDRRWHGIAAGMEGEPSPAAEGSEARFITENTWGYVGGEGKPTAEYEMRHPTWRLWQATWWRLDLDVAAVYGAPFAEALAAEPASVFVADGSPITLHAGGRLADEP